jgi:hypothetical protein
MERNMVIPQDAHLMYVVFKLMDRGLTGHQITLAMRKMVGDDWEDIPVSVLYRRLQENGLIFQDNTDVFIDDLEALIYGRNKLDDNLHLYL